ncbi:MAG: metallophosphoesterase family protein [Bacteroidota bacterium]
MLDLGKISGRMLIFGGVYSNLQALEAMYQTAENQGIPAKNIVCTGDVVAYCAQPEESVRLIRDWGIHCITGNVEIQLATGQDDCACDFVEGGRCDSFSRLWYPYAQAKVSESSLDWMRNLPAFLQFEYAGKQVAVVHGSFHYTAEFIFQSTDWSVKQKNFTDLKADVILAGHCGLPFVHEKNEKLWLNAGVIGMPANDGTPRVWYLLLDDRDGFQYLHRPLMYDYKKASMLMMENNLPPEYAKTLVTGIWDNCEILPEAETKTQGIALDI